VPLLTHVQYPEFDAHLPWRCIQRRNVSILYAYEQGCDVIIAIDDDNYVLPGTDFVGTHVAGLTLHDTPSLASSSGWLNVCKFLKDHRGTFSRPVGHAAEIVRALTALQAFLFIPADTPWKSAGQRLNCVPSSFCRACMTDGACCVRLNPSLELLPLPCVPL
jgi:hypothetical protein